MALRPTDPALLHYRSGGFYFARAQQVPGSTPVRDVLQGLMALADEPIAGGRHKVFGHPDLAIIPQTSTIASHLPRSVGLAIALHRAYRLGVACEWPADAVVVCSFGDASANHSTAVGAINTALNTAYRGLPAPILFVCEDNGWGISVPTPSGWIEAAYGSRPGLDYAYADGADPIAAAPVIAEAVRTVREQRRPVFLHLKTVRFLGSRGQRCRDRLPASPGHRGRLRPRSPAGHGPGAGRRRGRARGGAGPLRSHPDRDRRRGRPAGRWSTARLGGGGHGPPRSAPSGAGRRDGGGTAAVPPRSSRAPWPSRSTPRWIRSWPWTAG